MQQYYVHGILNECEEITVNVFATSEAEAMNRVVDLVKQYNEDDVFDVEAVELIEELPNTNHGLDGY